MRPVAARENCTMLQGLSTIATKVTESRFGPAACACPGNEVMLSLVSMLAASFVEAREEKDFVEKEKFHFWLLIS